MTAPARDSSWRESSLLLAAALLGVGGPLVAATIAWQRGMDPGLVWTSLAASAAVLLAAGLVLLARHLEGRRHIRAARTRAEAEQMLREVVDGVTSAVFILKAIDGGGDFCCTAANAAAAGLTGRARSRLEGARLTEIFTGETGRRLLDAVHRCWRSGARESLPPGHHAEPPVAWFDATIFRLADGSVVIGAHDLSPQKKVESELRAARGELELALEALRFGLWSWSPGQRQLRIDARCAGLLGLAEGGLVPPDTLAQHIHPEDLPGGRREVERVVAEGSEAEFEFRVARCDGAWRRLCVRARPVVDGDGALLRVVGCAWDVTERHEMELNLQRMQRLESLGTLANGVAHNLNNALAPIAMGLDLLRRRLRDDIVARDSLDTMTASIRRAASVVRQLAVSTQGAVGRHMLVSPRRLLDEVEKRVRPGLRPEVELHVHCGTAEIPLLWVDASRVQGALVQLCCNACEAISGTGRVEIECSMLEITTANHAQFPELKPGCFVVFRVSDTGPGVPAAIRQRIFDPFFSTKEVGRGVGLGLSAVLGVVRAHGGGIACEEAPGGGALFTILLPAARATAESVLSSLGPLKAEEAGSAARASGADFILVADDEAAVRNLTRRALELEGYRVQMAADGKEALAIFARDPAAVSLVILDLGMPVMDGATAAAAMVRLRPDVRIIAATGFTAEEILEDARQAGVKSFLPKPFSLDALIDAVRHAIDRPA